jgi:hypothetical protein
MAHPTILQQPRGSSATNLVGPAGSVKLRERKPGYTWLTTGQMRDRLAQAITDPLKAKGFKRVALPVDQLPLVCNRRSFRFQQLTALATAGIEVKLSEEYSFD